MLFNAYTSPTAQYEATNDTQDGMNDWASIVSFRTQWDNNSMNTINIFSLTEMANANRHTAKYATKK